MSTPTNLRPIRRSYRRPQAGDIFVMRPMEDRYLYGRVILADRPREVAPMPGANLIYVYRDLVEAPDSRADPPRDRLLIPPMWINQMPWTKGLFFTVTTRPLSPSAKLAEHCFIDWNGSYVDEVGKRLQAPFEPCGLWGLAGYHALDVRISDALGIPRAGPLQLRGST